MRATPSHLRQAALAIGISTVAGALGDVVGCGRTELGAPEVGTTSCGGTCAEQQPDTSLDALDAETPTTTEDAGADADAGQTDGSSSDSDAGLDASHEVPDGGVDDAGCGIRVATGSVATTYQVNRAHDGFQPWDWVPVPLCKRWVANVSGIISYPVVANGRVFFTVPEVSGYGERLYALDAHTGATLWGPISLGGYTTWSATAWESGRVFAANGSGSIRAFSDDTGALLWTKSVGLPITQMYASPPVAVGGRVYTQPESGGIWVQDSATGITKWTAGVIGAMHQALAVSETSVFLTSGCSAAEAYDLGTHSLLWKGSASCNDFGGGGAQIYSGGRLYARSFAHDGVVYDANSGSALGLFTSRPAPAIGPALAYFVNEGDVQAVTLDQLVPKWTFSGHDVVSAPIIVGNAVVVAGASSVWVLDAQTGDVLGSDSLPGKTIAPDEWNYTGALGGLAAADGMLFVPTTTSLVAY